MMSQSIRSDVYEIPEETLAKVRELMSMDFSKVISILKAVSDSTRLRILKSLLLEELCVCVFVETIKCKYPALSYHLKTLKDAGLVTSERRGSFLIYRLTTLGKYVLKLISMLEDNLGKPKSDDEG
ncbi:ArsR/SmtB family transcription factor [Candidatus Alkanophaga liquidiphilum]|nr:DNA-binding transcriptional regulator [Candidatus Alkanophaga liquidiphilum]